ncbi:hypothetical protein HELRODRAFT_174965 [Helobdella robusta]|uniref:Major facilitator superfamily (MFS) profile domain-containing protein n=1 Tax=Helobdella robusta TaxID=6412 RepID=T1F8N6_HELRO|nr:hypothetical protein HELRODRAFT_174965 [Helobdella robusta]ESO01407.1 hypothetical protein HELRODRAFT_174965 [Helobdella robusta]
MSEEENQDIQLKSISPKYREGAGEASSDHLLLNSHHERHDDSNNKLSSASTIANNSPTTKITTVTENSSSKATPLASIKEVEVEVDGCYGILVAIASFLSCYVVGLVFIAFSILYPELVIYFEAKKGTIGWIGSLYLATGNLCGIMLGVGIQYFGCRVVAIAGAFVWSLGFFLSSFANNVVTLYFSYGIVGGVGFNMVTISSFVIVQKHFKKYRSLAAGLAAAGISLGTITSGPLTGFLIGYYGWRGALTILSGLTLNCCVFGSFYRYPRAIKSKVITIGEEPNNKIKTVSLKTSAPTSLTITTEKNNSTTPKQQQQQQPQNKQLSLMTKKLCKDLSDLSLFKNKQFTAACIATLLFNLGTSMFYQHTPSRALTYGIAKQPTYLIQSVVGFVTLTARIVGAVVGNCKCTDRILQYGLSILLGGLCLVFTSPATTFLSICVIASCCGFAAGLTMTIQTTVMTDIVGVALIHRAQAFILVFMGLGALISVPLAGSIYDLTKDYNIPFFLFGSFQIFGGLIMVVAHIVIKIASKRILEAPPKV